MSTDTDNNQIIQQCAKEIFPQLEHILKTGGEKMLLTQVRHFADQFMEHEEYKKHVSCKKGCSFCCHSEIYCTSFEAKDIKKFVRKNKIKYDKELLKKQRKGYDNLKWAEKKCVFLSNKGECNIYEVRPMVCRTHNAISDPEICDRSVIPDRATREMKSPEVEGATFAMAYLDPNQKELKNIVDQI